MANATIGSKAVGSIVKLTVGGSPRNFIIVHQGKPSSMYDESCNGTWLLMEEAHERQKFHSVATNDYALSDANKYLNGSFLNLLDAGIVKSIRWAKIPYRPGDGHDQTVASGGSGLPVRVFLLSVNEVAGIVYQAARDGAQLAYFSGLSSPNAKFKATLDKARVHWWTRTPDCNPYGQTNEVCCISADGAAFTSIANTYETSFALRPALILPSTLLVSEDGAVIANTAPSTPGSITIPASIQGGTSVAVSWSASTDEQGNLEGYVVERSVDGGTSWAQIYQGGALSTANMVPFGTQSVMYRVKACDSEGLSSGWRTSAAVPVINNVAPGAPAFITVPETVLGGQPLTVSWGAATDSDDNLDQYHLERSVDGSAWAEIYSGPDQNFTDSITKGWRTVAYRVRAADGLGAFGGYAASPVREVDNNTAPVISCAQTGDLGEKTAGFTVSYHVSDEENDAVAVTEILDGTPKRTFQAGEGANSFAVTGETFMKLSNGPHAMLIQASDGKITATHELSFSKRVTSASVTLAEPMEAGEAITLCALSVSGSIPADAAFQVEVTNNAKDPAPVWEDCTTAVRNGLNHIFTNQTATNGAAFNFRVTAERGGSGQGGYFTSIQGGFQ